MQKIVAISMVKNEADVIESFVRHTLTFADELLIADHASSDKTGEILRSLQQEGLPIVLTKILKPEQMQAEVMTGLIYNAIDDHGADIVIPLDADEFVVSTEPGSPSPKEILQGLDPGQVYRLHMRTYAPQSDFTGGNRFLLDCPCRRDRCLSFPKVIVGAKLAKSRPLRVTQGSHEAHWKDVTGEQSEIPWQPVPFLHLAHFPERSRAQLLSKTALLGIGTAAKYTVNTPSGSGPHLCKRIIKGETVDYYRILDGEDIDLRPFSRRQHLKYSADVCPDHFRSLLAASLNLAEKYREKNVLQQKRTVTIVIPHLGCQDAIGKALDDALQQTYPFKEIFVCNLTSEVLSKDAFTPKSASVHLIQNLPDKGVFSQLKETATGDYVAWLLPGNRWRPDNLMKLVACIESQDRAFDFLFQNRMQDLVSWHPGLSISSDDSFLLLNADRFRHLLLQHGKCPVCGISSALVPRPAMQRIHWFRDCFMNGQLLELFCWQALLADSIGQHNSVGGLQNCYMERNWDAAPMNDLILHQLAWYALTECHQNDFEPAERTEILQRMRFVYDALMEATDQRLASDPSPLARQYNRLMDEIDGKIHA